MKNCVSLEIAQKLKAAGFPQPEQLMSSDLTAWVYKAGHAMMDKIPLTGSTLFAPTVGDILPLMDAEILHSKLRNEFICHAAKSLNRFRSKNIHDAAALAWLHINENK